MNFLFTHLLLKAYYIHIARTYYFCRTAENNLVLGQVVPDASLPTCQEVDCTLLPGQVSLHGWRTVHSSQPNTSEEDRVGKKPAKAKSKEARKKKAVDTDRAEAKGKDKEKIQAPVRAPLHNAHGDPSCLSHRNHGLNLKCTKPWILTLMCTSQNTTGA